MFVLTEKQNKNLTMKREAIKFFSKNGYVIVNLFNSSQIDELKKNIIDRINFLGRDEGVYLNKIRDYHNLKLSSKAHSYVINGSTRYISLNKKLTKKINSNNKILNIINNYWGHSKFSIKWVHSIKDNMIKTNATGFRIARPCKKNPLDVGGVHFDLVYGRIDHLLKNKNSIDHKSLVTIWCPIEGFSEKYSLRISPKSHLKNHSFSQIINQKKYLSPVFKKSYVKKFKFLRPRLKKGQAILFHPNLLHGGSFNKGKKTRASIDIRVLNNLKTKL